jgi:hypothetical protein
MIKVKYIDRNDDGILISRCRLILVELSDKERMNNTVNSWILKDNKTFYFKPIIVSETESINDGDKVLVELPIGLCITEVTGVESPYFITKAGGLTHPNTNPRKVIAMPKNISMETLQSILDGELKDGDEVFIECENISLKYDINDEFILKTINNHIKIIKKEKTYTAKQVRFLILKYNLDHPQINPHGGNEVGEWCENNIK